MLYRILIYLLLSLNLINCVPQSDPQLTRIKLPLPKSYIINTSISEINIDGVATEEAWSNAEWTDYFIDIEGEKKPTPYFDTRVKMLWDDKFIYFYTEMQESHIWGNLTERDAVIFYNNDFEIFIKPNEVQPTYAEFEINALGTLWDLLLVRPYRRNGPVFNEWDIYDTQIGIHYNGTLNDPSDVDESWSIEIAIPIDPIKSIDRGSEIRHGSYWRINFSRVQWQHDVKDGIYDRKKDSTGNYTPENNWVWSEQSAIAMHRPEHWGYLYFNSHKDREIQKIAHEEMVQYQFLFYLYRMQLEFFNLNKRFGIINDFYKPHERYFLVNGVQLTATFNNIDSGFEIMVDGLEVEALVINQDGYINTLK